ncbi:MAG: hypothetical protein V1656_00115 [Candidatus Jorgensenbacteria bacterium]
MERTRKTTWYVYPKDSHTQAVVAMQLKPDEDFLLDCKCEDGERRDLWKTDYALVEKLKNSVKKKEALYFLIFKQENEGPVRLWKGFPKERQREAQALVRRARQIRMEQKRAAL